MFVFSFICVWHYLYRKKKFQKEILQTYTRVLSKQMFLKQAGEDGKEKKVKF